MCFETSGPREKSCNACIPETFRKQETNIRSVKSVDFPSEPEVCMSRRGTADCPFPRVVDLADDGNLLVSRCRAVQYRSSTIHCASTVPYLGLAYNRVSSRLLTAASVTILQWYLFSASI